MRIENYRLNFVLTLYLRQCDKSIQDTFDDGMSQSKNVKVNTNNQRAANWSEEKKSDNKNDTNPNIIAEGLTGSELVRKYVTFHFFFPVGQHHRVARRAGEGEEVVAGSAALLDLLLVLFHVPLLHRLPDVIFLLLPCQFLHPPILVQIVVQFPLVRGVYVGLASGIIGRG